MPRSRRLLSFRRIRKADRTVVGGDGHTATGSAAVPHCAGRRPGGVGSGDCVRTGDQSQDSPAVAGAFRAEGLQGLWEIAPGRGRKATYGPERVKAVIDATLQSKPKGQTHWSCRLMAASQGISKSTVSNLWRSHNIKPHRTKTFKLSRDPKFLEKLTDVVGLYLNPPDKAIVLCVDEKSQIQALNRTQPGLPLKKGRCGTMTHDYKRNGTTTSVRRPRSAAGQSHRRMSQATPASGVPEVSAPHRSRVSGGKTLHSVMDNYGTHGTARGQSLAEQASPLRHPLRSHQLQLVEPDRTLVR